jgi:hypothetical protein
LITVIICSICMYNDTFRTYTLTHATAIIWVANFAKDNYYDVMLVGSGFDFVLLSLVKFVYWSDVVSFQVNTFIPVAMIGHDFL